MLRDQINLKAKPTMGPVRMRKEKTKKNPQINKAQEGLLASHIKQFQED